MSKEGDNVSKTGRTGPGKGGGKDSEKKGRPKALESQSTPEINVQGPKEKDTKGEDDVNADAPRGRKGRPVSPSSDQLSPGDGSTRPRASSDSASFKNRVLAGFRHMIAPDEPVSPTRSEGTRPRAKSQDRLSDAFRLIDSDEMRKRSPTPGKGNPGPGRKKNEKGSDVNSGKPRAPERKPKGNSGPARGGNQQANNGVRGGMGRGQGRGRGRGGAGRGQGLHRSKSQENTGKLGNQNKSEKHDRASSTSPRRNKGRRDRGPPLFDVQREGRGTDAENTADRWFKNLEQRTERLFSENGGHAFKRVRIAILDTGVQKRLRKTMPDIIKDHGDQIIDGRGFGDIKDWDRDENGHGTHVTGLIMRIAPRADIFIARILRGWEDTINPQNVVDAMKCAIDEWDVDIISMSFGWSSGLPGVETEILRANSKHILIFAAASNDGASEMRTVAWPARHPGVTCVYSADGDGVASGFNPPATSNFGLNISALGEAVESAWPLQLLRDEEKMMGTKRKSGTSFATPIAAATAALILELARKPPLAITKPAVAEQLKKLEVMSQVFSEKMSERKDWNMLYVYPWHFLTTDKAQSVNGPFGAWETISNELYTVVRQHWDV